LHRDKFACGLAAVDEKGRPLRRTMGIASLGGATLDNEENYLIKELFAAGRRDPNREPGIRPHAGAMAA